MGRSRFSTIEAAPGSTRRKHREERYERSNAFELSLFRGLFRKGPGSEPTKLFGKLSQRLCLVLRARLVGEWNSSASLHTCALRIWKVRYRNRHSRSLPATGPLVSTHGEATAQTAAANKTQPRDEMVALCERGAECCCLHRTASGRASRGQHRFALCPGILERKVRLHRART